MSPPNSGDLLSDALGPVAWQPVGAPAPALLTDARLQLHHAAQLAAAPGVTLAPPADDFAHMSLSWSPPHAAMLGEPVGTAGLRVGLVPGALALFLLDGDGTERARLRLDRRTRQEALDWLEETLGAELDQHVALTPPEHELPAHAVAEDAPFALATVDGPVGAFSELARWYANAHALLAPLREGERQTTPLRCWPHHFDIAFLSLLDGDAQAEDARSVNVGLSPGDAGIAEPYFYVTPWPAPDARSLPAPPDGGAWHTSGWTGAVLTASRLLEAGDAAGQAALAETFLRSALRAGHALLEAGAGPGA
jgi:hypothetical protein